jgi:hypothetical protein
MQWPFQPILDRTSFRFRKVYLSESAYIYRLLTHRDLPGLETPVSVDALSLVPGVPVNIEARNIIFDYFVHFGRQPMDGYPGTWYRGDHVLVQANANGAFIEFLLQTDVARNTELVIGATTAPDFGSVRVQLDGNTVIESFSLYAHAVGTTVIRSDKVFLQAGIHRLRIEFVDEPSHDRRSRFGLDYVSISSAPES